MANENKPVNSADDLRRMAEEKLDGQAPTAEPSMEQFDSMRLLHELQVHQIELEMQNEELFNTINKLRKSEEQLLHREMFLSAIINTDPECIKLLDIEGNLQMMNPAGLEIIGADSFEQVNGQCVYPLVSTPHREAFIALTNQVFQGNSGTLEFEAIGLKGRHVWLETHAVPFRNQKGEITSLLGVARDITLRKQIEKEKEDAINRVKKLEGIIPICMYCKKIRDDHNFWHQLEEYITENSEAVFSHGMCPECSNSYMDDFYKKFPVKP